MFWKIQAWPQISAWSQISNSRGYNLLRHVKAEAAGGGLGATGQEDFQKAAHVLHVLQKRSEGIGYYTSLQQMK